MDDYGCFADVESDYEELAREYVRCKNITFAWSRNQTDAYIITLNGAFKKFGVLPFGGKPDNFTLISVLLRGAFWFDLYSYAELHPNYVREKLGVGGGSADDLAYLITKLREKLLKLERV